MKTKWSGDFLCSGRVSQASFLRLKDSKSATEGELRAVYAPTAPQFCGQQGEACMLCSGRQGAREGLGTRALFFPRDLKDGCCFLLRSLISGSGLCQKRNGSGDRCSLFSKLCPLS